MAEMMRAVVLDAPGAADALRVLKVPVPEAKPGWVLLRVEAFGLNRSELHTRLGMAGDGVTFPRVLGIEATGVVEAAPDHPEWEGQKAVTMMGGMGRTFDGGYAEYTLVPTAQVIPVNTDLDWGRLGALPEVLQTAYGSMAVGIRPADGDTILIRGGTSSVGLMTAILASRRKMRVLSTTRKAGREALLRGVGVTDVIIDDGEIAEKVRALVPDGVDGGLELVGAPTLEDTLNCVKPGGTVCFSGMLSNEWTIESFYPIAFIPRGVRLTAYGGGAADLPSHVLEEISAALLAGDVTFPVKTYPLDAIAEAHRDMEQNRVAAKQVVLTRG